MQKLKYGKSSFNKIIQSQIPVAAQELLLQELCESEQKQTTGGKR